jgi:ABC-type glycerol-3-phosphate transport system substrate-binding protein
MKDVSTASWYLRSEFTNEITQALGRAIERVIYDGADPKASLDQAQAEAEKVLKK